MEGIWRIQNVYHLPNGVFLPWKVSNSVRKFKPHKGDRQNFGKVRFEKKQKPWFRFDLQNTLKAQTVKIAIWFLYYNIYTLQARTHTHWVRWQSRWWFSQKWISCKSVGVLGALPFSTLEDGASLTLIWRTSSIRSWQDLRYSCMNERIAKEL